MTTWASASSAASPAPNRGAGSLASCVAPRICTRTPWRSARAGCLPTRWCICTRLNATTRAPLPHATRRVLRSVHRFPLRLAIAHPGDPLARGSQPRPHAARAPPSAQSLPHAILSVPVRLLSRNKRHSVVLCRAPVGGGCLPARHHDHARIRTHARTPVNARTQATQLCLRISRT